MHFCKLNSAAGENQPIPTPHPDYYRAFFRFNQYPRVHGTTTPAEESFSFGVYRYRSDTEQKAKKLCIDDQQPSPLLIFIIICAILLEFIGQVFHIHNTI
jgi:hypothetical protein